MKLLEKHFDLAFTAPNGVQKLRELILTFAMQGKLVPQDPNDQPASELLKAIEAEKQRLVKKGKLKQAKPLPEIKPEEVPYDLPRSWKWCRWNNVALKIGDVDHKMPVEVADGVPYVSPRDFFGKNEIAFAQAKKISIQDFEMLRLKIQPEKFDIIFPRYGTLGVNRFVLVDIAFLASYSCAVVKNFEGFVDPKYSYYYSISKLVRAEIERYTKKTTQANVGVQSIQIFLYPLPPLAEQHRIVAKIDRLMACCDELEKLRADRNQKRITIHTAALNRLLTAKESSDFSTAWRFITQHFGELYSVKENVAELRKAILQLAIMGKLVPQDLKDEPANELLKAIEAEKQRLVKEGKIKRQKALPEIIDEEKDFILPLRWEWARLQDVLDVRDGTHDSPVDATGSDTYPFVTSKNFVNGKIDFSTARRISAKDHFEFTKRSKVDKLDILFSMIGGNIGNQVIVEDECDFSIKNVALFKYYNKQLTNPYFIKIYLEHLANGLQAKAAGGAQPFVSLAFLRNLVIALPPKEEQSRIVTKTNRLMALCDALEQQIHAAVDKQTNLLNSIMAQV